MDSIENRIIKQGLVAWKDCLWLQPENLKKQTPEQLDKLKKSITNNGFLSPFLVWENKSKTYILDAHHRQLALLSLETDGAKIPVKLPAVWIDAKDKKEAKKFILVYNAHYAKLNQDAVFDFISDMDIDALMEEVEIPEIDFEMLDFTAGELNDQGKLDELDPKFVECPSCSTIFDSRGCEKKNATG